METNAGVICGIATMLTKDKTADELKTIQCYLKLLSSAVSAQLELLMLSGGKPSCQTDIVLTR